MKKVFIVLIVAAMLFCVSFGSISAFADETEGTPTETELTENTGNDGAETGDVTEPETPGETGEEPAEEQTEEPTEEKSLTKEEIKEIIDAALTESQKQQAEKISAHLAKKLNVDETIIYIIIVGAVLIIFTFVFLIGRIIAISRSKAKTSEKLQAMQALLSDKIEDGKKLQAAISSLDKDSIQTTFAEVMKPTAEQITPEIINGVVEKLKLDDTKLDSLAETISIIQKALGIMAIKANQKEAALVLSGEQGEKAVE